MATIPVGDVIDERPFTRADTRTFTADPGPGNPRVGPSGSPEAQAYRSQGLRTPPAGPQGPMPGRVARLGRGLRSLVGGVPGLVAAGIGAGVAGVDQLGQAFAEKNPTFDNNTMPGATFDIMTGMPMDGGAPAGVRAPNMVQSDPTPSLPAATAAPVPLAPNPTDMRLAAGTAATPLPSTGLRDNVVTRNGNAFSGTNIREGFTYADGRSPSGSLTVLPGGPSIPGAGSLPSNDQLAGAGGVASLGGSPGGSASAERFNQESLRDSLRQLASGRGQGGMQLRGRELADARASALRALEGFDQNETVERVATARERGDTARAGLRDATDRRGQDIGAAVALSGQGVALRTAAAATRADQANKDRQYQLDVEKFGVDQANTRFTQRQAGEKAFNDKLQNLFVTTDDKGKAVPDTAKIADFQTAVSQTLAARIDRARASGDPKLVAKAEELASRGVSALDDTDLAELRAKFLLRDRAQGARGIGPFAGTAAQSSNLDDFGATGIQRGVLQDRVQFPAGSLGVNDLKYTEPANAILPDIFKQPTRDFDFALRGLRQ